MDEVSYDYPYFLIVKSAGNDGDDGGGYFLNNNVISWAEAIPNNPNSSYVYTDSRPLADCAIDGGYDCIDALSTAKNALVVGSISDLPNGYVGNTGVLKSAFSVTGPTDDGRIKPDIMGNGEYVYSAYTTEGFAYAFVSGTSQAAPNVSGSLILLQQYYKSLNNDNPMRSATLKALAIHTADEAGDNPGPDYKFGWGLANIKNAVDVIAGNNSGHLIIENAIGDGATYTRDVIADGGGALEVTLVWTDFPGAEFTENPPVVDRSDPQLVNDLDITATGNGSTFYPWVLDPANPANAATTGINNVDNVEKIEIFNPGTHAYTISISHKGRLTDNDPTDGSHQAFSLIVSGEQVPSLCDNQPIFLQSETYTSVQTQLCSTVSISMANSQIESGASLELDAPFIFLTSNTHIKNGSTFHAYSSGASAAASAPESVMTSSLTPMGLMNTLSFDLMTSGI